MITNNYKITQRTKSTLLIGLLAMLLIPISTMYTMTAESNTITTASINTLTSDSTNRNPNIPTSIDSYEQITIDSVAMRQQIANDEYISVSFHGKTYDLQLDEFQMWVPDAKAYLRGENGELMEVPRMDLKTYHGYVAGEENSSVYVLASNNYFTAILRIADKEIRIDPLQTYDRNAQNTQHIMYEISVDTPDHKTSVIDTFENGLNVIPKAYAVEYANIIMDCDEEFFDLYPTTWQYHQGQALLESYYIFDDANLSFYISVNACDDEGDEYTESNIEDIMAQLQNYWDGDSTSRDFVILTSGKDFTGSVAGWTPHVDYPIADTANDAYAVVQMIADSNGSTGHSGSLFHRQITMGHEIGHIFGALHSNAEQVNPSPPGYWTIMKNSVYLSQLVALMSSDNIDIVEQAVIDYL